MGNGWEIDEKWTWDGHEITMRWTLDELEINMRWTWDGHDIPNIILQPVNEDFISQKCRENSRAKSRQNIDELKKIPKMLALYEVTTEHHTFPMLEARAVTAWRTGTLVFKNWCPYRFRLKYRGDRKCLYPPCQGDDSLTHVKDECEFTPQNT